MAGGKGEYSEVNHPPPPHDHPVDVHGGDYHPVRDPDEREHDADMDLAMVMLRSLTIITCIAAVMCMVVNAVSLARSFRWQFYVSIPQCVLLHQLKHCTGFMYSEACCEEVFQVHLHILTPL
jgi:hypothetical protein